MRTWCLDEVPDSLREKNALGKAELEKWVRF